MRSLIATAALIVAITGAPAAAQDLVVKHADLDLSTSEGKRTLEKRITAAARAYCGADRPRTGTRLDNGVSACMSDARTAAREQMATLIKKAAKGG